MRLIKKWEKKTVYKTSRGTVIGQREGDFVVVEVEDRLLAKYLKIVFKFKEEVKSKIIEKSVAKKDTPKPKVAKVAKRVTKAKKKSVPKKDVK